MISIASSDADYVSRFIKMYTPELGSYPNKKIYYQGERVDLLDDMIDISLYINIDDRKYTVELDCDSGLHEYDCPYFESAVALYKALKRSERG